MNQEEIRKAIKYYKLEDDEFFNFKTLKSTYMLYCLLCFFEHKRIKVTRLKGSKCETKIFNTRQWSAYTFLFSKR